MDKRIGLFWLRDDFRVTKNDGLIEATKNHDQVVVFYLYKQATYQKQQAQKWWLSKSLLNFRKKLNNLNINLEIIETNSYKFFFDKLFKNKDFKIYWNKVYEPDYIKFDKYLFRNFKNKNIAFKIFKGNVLNEIDEIKKKDGTPFKVFTPFWRNAEKYYIEKIPSKKKMIKKCKKKINYFKNCIEPEKILPKKDWFKNFENIWFPDEESALKELQKFIQDRISGYSEGRNFPNIVGTSKLSPFIKFGQIHVETIWTECRRRKLKSIGISKYLAEIGWREFNHSLINHFPFMLENNYSKKFDKFPWEKNSKFLSAWKKGLTGYPIVDAGMRELYATGWMHNRVRMIVGSFLVKHLLINWKEGEKYFKNCLLDYSPASNVAGWQWVAGCGADAAPYFRIFNPILQGEKFDKEGEYVKKWVPELKDLPKKFIHKPWELNEKKFKLGRDYPYPIVEHKVARIKALNAFKKI
ncbi:MAG: deoxyribodipyrimidine photo-lyase [Candidatus Pelagibacter bacterium]|nr:deoxyribodipyrimidine photo-lyase [Candidatus Pelagibacter bacterium]MBL6861069.1 deoxyribodipyrimidine photo-lyase [Candidatus Pelagibacter bacterium]